MHVASRRLPELLPILQLDSAAAVKVRYGRRRVTLSSVRNRLGARGAAATRRAG
jgi:hypothetical protein